MYKTGDMKPNGRFGNWLFENMVKRDMTCVDVAKLLRSTRQNIRRHINGLSRPQYVWVLAYCNLFDDDPEKVWRLVLEEL